MLDQFAVFCIQKHLSELFMLSEFELESVIHELLFHLLPILPQGGVGLSSQPESINRSLGLDDDVFHLFALKLLGLEVMFIGKVSFAIDLERGRIEVAQEAILFVFPVKLNDFGFVGFSLHSKRIIFLNRIKEFASLIQGRITQIKMINLLMPQYRINIFIYCKMKSMHASFHVSRKDIALDVAQAELFGRFDDLNHHILQMKSKSKKNSEGRDRILPSISLPKTLKHSQTALESSSLHFHSFTPKRSPFRIKQRFSETNQYKDSKNEANTTSESLDESQFFRKRSSLKRRRALKTRPQILSFEERQKLAQKQKENISTSVVVVCLDTPKIDLQRKCSNLSKKNMMIRFNILKKHRAETLPVEKQDSPLKFSISGWKAQDSDQE